MKVAIIKKIEEEIDQYINDECELSEGVRFSQYKLLKRLSLFQSQVYPKGKVDSQGNYKYWFDIIVPRINAEIKNIDFDTKDISIYSETSLKDRLAILLSNLFLKNWLYLRKKGEEINASVEGFSALGNIVWKKIKDGYEEVDLKNFYVLNQTAKTLEDSDVIERHILTQADLRAKKKVWENVDEVIKTCGNKFFKSTEKATEFRTTTPFYEIYERNGEISQKDFYEAKGKKGGGSEEKFVLAKVIVAGMKKAEGAGKYVLFVEEIKDKPYREAHRGKYEGRWLRKGLYETLFDCQTRANEIGNQIARGLEWASKTVFRTSDPTIVQNILTDIRSGDIIKTRDLAQVETRMQGLDQLVADWNRNIEHANELANSYEVVTGESLPSGTPFRLGAMMNQNANKLFDFLREKLAIALEELFTSWILPDIFKDLKKETVLDFTGNEEYLEDYYEILVNAWYVNNLLNFPPHSTDQARILKSIKLEELKKNKNASIKIEKGFWDKFKPRVKVVISGESVNLMSELETLYSFINLETDPVRRSYLIDLAMAKKNIDVSGLPRMSPEQLGGAVQPTSMMQGGAPVLTT